jgi:bifunctional DNA-binding transcriptional regulator/antitoxin component of YhaV-PrlF toxin-antitoxin module
MMTTVRYKARVRREGSLAIPKKAPEAQGLQQGDKVDVVMSRADAADREPTHNWNGKASLRRLESTQVDLATSDRGFNPMSRVFPRIEPQEDAQSRR